MSPLQSRPASDLMSWAELAELAQRVVSLRAESTELVADTREIVRRSRELVAQIQAERARDFPNVYAHGARAAS